MGFFQKLFKRNNKTADETVEKETIQVEVKDGKADVAPVDKVATKTTTKTATKTVAKTTTKQCAATTKAGSQCKRAPVGRSKFCTTHKN